MIIHQLIKPTITNNNKLIFIGNNIQIKAKSLLVRYIETVQFNNIKIENYDIYKLISYINKKGGMDYNHQQKRWGEF